MGKGFSIGELRKPEPARSGLTESQLTPEQREAAAAAIANSAGMVRLSVSLPFKSRPLGADGTYCTTRHINQIVSPRRIGVLLGLLDGYVASGRLGRNATYKDALWTLLDDIEAVLKARKE